MRRLGCNQWFKVVITVENNNNWKQIIDTQVHTKWDQCESGHLARRSVSPRSPSWWTHKLRARMLGLHRSKLHYWPSSLGFWLMRQCSMPSGSGLLSFSIMNGFQHALASSKLKANTCLLQVRWKPMNAETHFYCFACGRTSKEQAVKRREILAKLEDMHPVSTWHVHTCPVNWSYSQQ